MSNLKSIRFTQFFHRLNADSTFDSICSLCFRTVAAAADKEFRRIEESAHTCPQAASAKVIPFIDRRKYDF
jgi:hypothetical protein